MCPRCYILSVHIMQLVMRAQLVEAHARAADAHGLAARSRSRGADEGAAASSGTLTSGTLLSTARCPLPGVAALDNAADLSHRLHLGVSLWVELCAPDQHEDVAAASTMWWVAFTSADACDLTWQARRRSSQLRSCGRCGSACQRSARLRQHQQRCSDMLMPHALVPGAAARRPAGGCKQP